MASTKNASEDGAERDAATLSSVPGMGRKAVRAVAAFVGGARLAAGKILGPLLGMGRLLVVAHLLGPDGPRELGSFAVAVLAIELARTMSEIGLRQALIQRPEDPALYVNTAWTTEVIRGVVLGAVLFIIAPWLTAFFDKPAAEIPLRILALAPALVGFQNVWTFSFDRQLKFHKKFALQVVPQVIGVVAVVVWAWVDPSVWALVAGTLGAVSSQVVLSYVLCRRFCRFELSARKFRPLFSFGFWIFLSALLTITMNRGGHLVIAKLLPAAVLGVFMMADSLSSKLILQFAQVGGQAVFPVFSRLQREKDRLRSGFLRAFFAMAAVELFVCAAMVALAADAVEALLSPSWRPAVPLIQILGLGAIYGASAIMDVLFRAVGQPRRAVIYTAVSVTVFAVAVYPMAKAFGPWGVALTLTVSRVVGHAARYPSVLRLLRLPLRQMLAPLVVPVGAGLVSMVACHFVRQALPGLSALPRLLLCIGVLAILHAAVYVIADRLLPFRVLGALSEIVRSYLPKRGGSDKEAQPAMPSADSGPPYGGRIGDA